MSYMYTVLMLACLLPVSCSLVSPIVLNFSMLYCPNGQMILLCDEDELVFNNIIPGKSSLRLCLHLALSR